MTMMRFVMIAIIGLSMPAGCASPPALTAQWLHSLGEDRLEEPIGVALHGTELFVTDVRQGKIFRFKTGLRDGALEPWPVDDDAGITRPMHLTVDDAGRVYVADHLRDKVFVFDDTGSLVRFLGGAGSGPGQFDSPAGVAVDADGFIYVADFNNHRVQKFDAGGAHVLSWGEQGSDHGQFNYPTDIAIGPSDGRVYVADAYNHRVQVFTPHGEFVRAFGTRGSSEGEFNVAVGLTVDHRGRVFVADQFNHRIQVFAEDGTWIGAFGGKNDESGSLDRPSDVAVRVDSGGTVRAYVADFGRARISVFRVQETAGVRRERTSWQRTGLSNTSLGRYWP